MTGLETALCMEHFIGAEIQTGDSTSHIISVNEDILPSPSTPTVIFLQVATIGIYVLRAESLKELP